MKVRFDGAIGDIQQSPIPLFDNPWDTKRAIWRFALSGWSAILRDRHAVLRIQLLSRPIPVLAVRAEPTVAAAVGSRESSVIPSSEALHSCLSPLMPV